MKTLSKYLLVFTFLFSSLIFADDEKRIEPGSRKFTEQETKEIKEIEKQDYKINKKEFPEIYDNQYPPLIFNHYIHNLIGISALGDFLIIEDQSEWTIRRGYANEAFSWKENDPIILVLNDSFISSHLFGYKYKMINSRTNTAIEVKLKLSPILNNPYTLQIIALSPITYEVILSDNSIWHCDPSQYYLFTKWIIGDVIIIGTNVKSCFDNSYENLLINVNLLKEIKANRIQ